MDRFFSFLTFITFIPRRVEQAYVPQTFTEMDEPCVRQDAPYNITDEWFSNQPRLEPEKVIENEPTYEVYNVYLNPNGTIRLDETKQVEEFDETKLILLDPYELSAEEEQTLMEIKDDDISDAIVNLFS